MGRWFRTKCIGVVAVGLAACLPVMAGTFEVKASTAPPGSLAPGEEYDENAELVVGVNAWDSFDPIETTLASVAGRWLAPVYDLLVRLLPDGSYGPGLATGWEFIEGDTPVLRLTLREGVTFHDGTPFDADAVKANLDRSLDSSGSILAYLRTVDSVAVVDPTTVELTLMPGSGYNTLWGLTMAAGRMISPATFDQAATHPVGTGPFIFESMTPDTATYVRNPDYWGGAPMYAKLVIQGLQSNNTPWITGMLSGAIDVGRLVGPSEAELDQVRSADGFVVEELPFGQFDYISLNRAEPPFDDLRVRQAVAYALDYEGMGAALGYAPVRQPVRPGTGAYDEALNGNYTYDPDRARELLAEAGHADGVDAGELFFTPNGTIPRLAQIAQEQLSAVGIRAELRPLENAAQVAQVCGGGQADCRILAYSVLSWDPLYVAEQFLSPPATGANLGGAEPDPELAELLATAQRPASQEEHDASITALIAAMNAQVINVFTGLVPTYAIYREDVRNVAAGWYIESHPDPGILAVVQ